jgi:protein-L-isoaspartate(D-aspartate) O-methyltransferase
MDIELARFNMIEQQIRPWEVLDDAVLSLLGDAARGVRAPRTAALAFVDTAGAAAGTPGECMLEPKVEARLLQELHCSATTRCWRSAPARDSWPRCWRTARCRW